nr:hypothetical protein [Tanacetum cinerariifolium]
MLDSYTSVVCTVSWGRSSYERDRIELRVNVELKDTFVVSISKIEGEGYTLSTIRIEYERRSSRCSSCKDKHSSVPSSSSCDEPPKGKEANLTLVSMPNTSMEEQVEELDSKVKDIEGDTARFMSLSNRADGSANDTSLLEDEYYDIYDRK